LSRAQAGLAGGIASVLGEAGATVYVTGRSIRGNLTQPDLPGTTIEETAELVTACGGLGVSVRVLYRGGHKSFDAVFWERPIERWGKMWSAGVRATLAITKAALPLMFSRRHGVIVNTTLEIDPTFYDAALYYCTAKLAINYLTFGMAHDLHQRGGFPIPVIGLAMGWMRTEAVLENFRQGLDPAERPAETDSVEYDGRAVLALVTDPHVMQKTEKYSVCAILPRNMALRMSIIESDIIQNPLFDPFSKLYLNILVPLIPVSCATSSPPR
jgi:NAD(P)-dependent dehydrogenase (short-subunit alcohol dehydrogenase family)